MMSPVGWFTKRYINRQSLIKGKKLYSIYTYNFLNPILNDNLISYYTNKLRGVSKGNILSLGLKRSSDIENHIKKI